MNLILKFFIFINLRLPPEAIAPMAAVVVVVLELVLVPHVREDALDELVAVRLVATVALRDRLRQRFVVTEKR